MTSVSLAQAKAQLSALVARAEAGDDISITRHGKPVARLVAAERPLKPVDTELLRKFVETMPVQEQSTEDFIRQMRDEARY